MRQQLAETQLMLQEAQSRLLSHESSLENLSVSDTSWQHNPKYNDTDEGPIAPVSHQKDVPDIQNMLNRLVQYPAAPMNH